MGVPVPDGDMEQLRQFLFNAFSDENKDDNNDNKDNNNNKNNDNKDNNNNKPQDLRHPVFGLAGGAAACNAKEKI